jgi:hypothetical protein
LLRHDRPVTLRGASNPPEGAGMRVPDELKKCVVFIGVESDSGVVSYRGTAFFVRIQSQIPNHSIIYLVTARHVVAEISKGHFFIRANTKDGQSVTLKGDSTVKWWFHPKEDESSDVAVIQMSFPKPLPELLDFAALPIEMILTDEKIKAEGVGIGDDIAITGLFSRHAGNAKNLPIVRSGNIAMMPDEPMPTPTFGNMEVYLVEARSIGGLSGSPVVVFKEYELGKMRTHLLGLVHGHWNLNPGTTIDVVEEDSQTNDPVNMGIVLVVPAKKILETINQQQLVDLREKLAMEWHKKNSPTKG